jgi:hypothetical protein
VIAEIASADHEGDDTVSSYAICLLWHHKYQHVVAMDSLSPVAKSLGAVLSGLPSSASETAYPDLPMVYNHLLDRLDTPSRCSHNLSPLVIVWQKNVFRTIVRQLHYVSCHPRVQPFGPLLPARQRHGGYFVCGHQVSWHRLTGAFVACNRHDLKSWVGNSSEGPFWTK